MITTLLNILILFMLFLISYFFYLNYKNKKFLILSLFWTFILFSYVFKFIELITELRHISLIFFPIAGFLLLNLFYKSNIIIVLTTILSSIWPFISTSFQTLLPYLYLGSIIIFSSIKLMRQKKELKIITIPFLSLGLIYILKIFILNLNQLILVFHLLILINIILLIFNNSIFKRFRSKKKIYNDRLFVMNNLLIIIVCSLLVWVLVATYTHLPQKIISLILFNSFIITYITGILIYALFLYIILSLSNLYFFKKRYLK